MHGSRDRRLHLVLRRPRFRCSPRSTSKWPCGASATNISSRRGRVARGERVELVNFTKFLVTCAGRRRRPYAPSRCTTRSSATSPEAAGLMNAHGATPSHSHGSGLASSSASRAGSLYPWTRRLRRDRRRGMRLLNTHPEIAADIYAAVVCGNRARRGAAERAAVAGRPQRRSSQLGAAALCVYARLPLPSRCRTSPRDRPLLLDRGANPNAYYMAGHSGLWRARGRRRRRRAGRSAASGARRALRPAA